MSSGYPARSQAGKLGLRSGQRVYLHRAPSGWDLTDPPDGLTDAGPDGPARLHAALGLPWPCETAAKFGPAWDDMVAGLREAGVRVGLGSYAGWNDSDRTFAAAIWCGAPRWSGAT